MSTTQRLVPPTLLVLILSGCIWQTSSASPTAQPSPASQAPVSQAPVSQAPVSQAPPASGGAPSAAPSPTLTPPTCDLPIHLDATVAIANITDVRVATHDDYDRVVFEFSGGLPEIFIERASPPFTQDASGLPISVEGTSFLRITLRGGTKVTSSGEASYTGPLEFRPGYPALVHLIEGGDFEAQSTWYAGLASEACLRVMTLPAEGGKMRLVIDIAH